MKKIGNLYIVATPIGNLDDITLRAISVLKEVDFIAAEDTRHTAKLLNHLSINKPMISYHDHNEVKSSAKIVSYLDGGKSIALVSDAGTPLISDPGFYLVRDARLQGHNVIPIPGPSAVMAALSVAGVPTNRFIFEGFLPTKSSSRVDIFKRYLNEQSTIIFYESPHRIMNTLNDMKEVFGERRYVVVARELTKTYESIYGGQVKELIDWMMRDKNRQKGEFVLLVHAAEKLDDQTLTCEVKEMLGILLKELSLKQAVAIAAKISSINKKSLYQYALTLTGKIA